MRRTAPALLLGFALLMAACSTTATSTTPPSTDAATSTTLTTITAPTTTPEPSTTTSPPATSATTTVPDTSPNTTVAAGIEIVVANGSVTGPDRIEVTLGETVEFTVVSDTADEVHVHGYDIFADVAPGTTGSLSFVADIPGIFEVELEGSHTVLTELLVQ